MDNPQHYQPLSHALHPPLRPTYPTYEPKRSSLGRGRGDDDDEEDEEDEEGAVQQQLDGHHEHESAPPSPQQPPPQPPTHVPETQQPATESGKRRPGRPRGSRNRKAGSTSGPTSVTPSKQEQPSAPPGASVQFADVNAQNQQYYEFQWRVLNLCAEFYGAAEELVKGTPPLVIAQCYQMGPSVKVDPLNLLNNAKQLCDTLLQNPSRLISNPPPPLYPVLPVYSTQTPAPTMIANPSSFTLSMNPQAAGVPPATAYPQYPTYQQAPYPTMPYYGYPGYPAMYYPAAQPQTVSAPQAQPKSSQNHTVISPPPVTITGNGQQGAWSDEETEKLQQLAESCKNETGEIDWDHVVQSWGSGRTRHQILIKATSLGLKESTSTRGVKRRRGDADVTGDTTISHSVPESSSAVAGASTAHDSPAQSHATPPTTSSAAQKDSSAPTRNAMPVSSLMSSAPSTSTSLPWPMPTVAVNTPSPVIAASDPSNPTTGAGTAYFRSRDISGPKTTTPTGERLPVVAPHHYTMYASNGIGARRGKD